MNRVLLIHIISIITAFIFIFVVRFKAFSLLLIVINSSIQLIIIHGRPSQAFIRGQRVKYRYCDLTQNAMDFF